MPINKVEYYGETLIDLTNDTVTPENLDEGVTAHNATGSPITGTRTVINPSDYVPKSGTTMTGALIAQNNSQYLVAQVRNVVFVPDGDELPTGSNGDFCFTYIL